MSKLCYCRVTLISLFTTISLSFAPGVYAAEPTGEQELKLGTIPMDTPAEMARRLKPLTQYLSVKTGLTVNFRGSLNFGDTIDYLGTNKIQIAYLSPAAYIEAREKYAVIPLVNSLNKGKGTFTLLIAVQKDSPIKTMSDLRGKKFAFGDKKAKLQPIFIESTGIKLSEFASYDFLNHYDNIAKALINGDFDAGILKDTAFEKYASQGLRAIHTSPPLPSLVFAVNKDLHPNTIAKLKNAMLALNNPSEENKAILTTLEQGTDGFEVANDKDFDGMRKLLAPSKDKK